MNPVDVTSLPHPLATSPPAAPRTEPLARSRPELQEQHGFGGLSANPPLRAAGAVLALCSSPLSRPNARLLRDPSRDQPSTTAGRGATVLPFCPVERINSCGTDLQDRPLRFQCPQQRGSPCWVRVTPCVSSAPTLCPLPSVKLTNRCSQEHVLSTALQRDGERVRVFHQGRPENALFQHHAATEQHASSTLCRGTGPGSSHAAALPPRPLPPAATERSRSRKTDAAFAGQPPSHF